MSASVDLSGAVALGQCEVRKRPNAVRCTSPSRYEGIWMCQRCGHAWRLMMCQACTVDARRKTGECRNDGCGGQVILISAGG